jgi:hypothetical protein
MIKKFDHLFKTELNEYTVCKYGTHRIITGDALPTVQRNFQIPKMIEEEIESEINKLLKAGIIIPSNSSWASRIIPVRKKNGDLRMSIDFRSLNDQTIKDGYPLPRIDEILDSIGCNNIYNFRCHKRVLPNKNR